MIPCMHELATNCGLLTSVALLVVMSLMWKMCVDVQFSSLDFSNAMGHRRSLLRSEDLVELWLWKKAAVGCELWKSCCGL